MASENTPIVLQPVVSALDDGGLSMANGASLDRPTRSTPSPSADGWDAMGGAPAAQVGPKSEVVVPFVRGQVLRAVTRAPFGSAHPNHLQVSVFSKVGTNRGVS